MLGFTACAWGVATDAEPDLGVLRSFWMKTLFALCAAALGIVANYHGRVRRWIPLTATALQGANWFVTSMCWFKPWLPPIAQVGPSPSPSPTPTPKPKPEPKPEPNPDQP